jgi:biopolymer transport protein TolR
MEHESRAQSTRTMSDINVTPFIDVLLVLLIIFMVVTPVSMSGLDTALPQEGIPPPPPPDHVLLLEISDGGLTLNHVPLAGLQDLDNRMRDALSARSDKTVFVNVVAERLAYGGVVTVLDTVCGAGAERIGLMNMSDPAQPLQ